MLDARFAADIAALRMAAPTIPGATAAADREAARRTAQEFEAVFVGQMVSHMFAGLQEDALFGGGQAGDLYRSMLNEEYGRAIAKSGGVGVADQVMKQILALQEGSSR
ncbi:MAG: rod-binding protein [Alphaproteobacteria bacterium]